jgi:hypothetical protein
MNTEILHSGMDNDLKQTFISDMPEEEWFGLFWFIPSAALKATV